MTRGSSCSWEGPPDGLLWYYFKKRIQRKRGLGFVFELKHRNSLPYWYFVPPLMSSAFNTPLGPSFEAEAPPGAWGAADLALFTGGRAAGCRGIKSQTVTQLTLRLFQWDAAKGLNIWKVWLSSWSVVDLQVEEEEEELKTSRGLLSIIFCGSTSAPWPFFLSFLPTLMSSLCSSSSTLSASPSWFAIFIAVSRTFRKFCWLPSEPWSAGQPKEETC